MEFRVNLPTRSYRVQRILNAAPETNARDFHGGWFHKGDGVRAQSDGINDFVDRVKYMIKSGGENIYPAEIEQVLLRDPCKC